MYNSQNHPKAIKDRQLFNLFIIVAFISQCRHINNINWVKNFLILAMISHFKIVIFLLNIIKEYNISYQENKKYNQPLLSQDF